jgi:predicted phosphate transport protein (TIGR00153 family)
MPELKLRPFRTTKILLNQIDELLDVVSQGALAYERGIRQYVRHGWDNTAQAKFEQLDAFESRGDALRKNIGQVLYTEMLLPDTSGDVLGMLGFLDRLLDTMHHSFEVVRVEQAEIPDEYNEDLEECVSMAAKTVEQVVVATRSYFRDPNGARDHIHKIHFFEHETEVVALRIMERLFQSNLPLERKLQLRGQVWLIDRVADLADDAGDTLAIYAVKRSV